MRLGILRRTQEEECILDPVELVISTLFFQCVLKLGLPSRELVQPQLGFGDLLLDLSQLRFVLDFSQVFRSQAHQQCILQADVSRS